MGQLHNWGGGVDKHNIRKDLATGPFYSAEQNCCLKISTVLPFEMKWLEKRVTCPPISCNS